MKRPMARGEPIGIARWEKPLQIPHPLVEHDSAWDFRSVYYEQPYPESPKGRSDVGSERIRFAPVILRMALTAGDPGEIRTASLFYIAHCVTYEMRLSMAASRIRAIAEFEERDIDVGLAQELMEEAEALLWGVALVACLRAIGWSIGQTQDPTARKPFAIAARSALLECGARAGLASVAADDAHAHLSLAERLMPPEHEPKRSEVEAGRRVLAELGFLHLCVGVARAYEEPWNPFVQERLRRELEEHEPSRAWVSGFHANLHALAEELLRAVREKHQDWQSSYEEFLGDGRHDIDAFFVARWRDDSIVEPEASLLKKIGQLHEREPQLQLIA